jgi:hypothetical protein
VLLEEELIDTPASDLGLTATLQAGLVQLEWKPATSDTATPPGLELGVRYDIFRGNSAEFTPGRVPLFSVEPSPFGSPGGTIKATVIHPNPANAFYRVCAVNGAGKRGCTAAVDSSQ